jgi:hypothetical protein
VGEHPAAINDIRPVHQRALDQGDSPWLLKSDTWITKNQLFGGADEMASTKSPILSSGRFRAMSAWLTIPTSS